MNATPTPEPQPQSKTEATPACCRGGVCGAPSAALAVNPAETAATCPIKKPWIRRLGAAAFLFFLIKGLAWLTVPALIVWWRS